MLTWTDVTVRIRRGNPPPPRRVERSEAEWQALLPAAVFAVTRHSATERPFSSDMCGLFTPGRYHCACCDTFLFDAQSKFDSGTGWPSLATAILLRVRRLGSCSSLASCTVMTPMP